MARKWLSGALAFAMIFGCSAPVALAEETPVEVVEVEQESLEGVEQYTVYAPSLSKSSVTVSESARSAEVTVSGVRTDAGIIYDDTYVNLYWKNSTNVLVVDAKDEFFQNGPDEYTLGITFESGTPDSGDDTYLNGVTLKVKKGEAVNIGNEGAYEQYDIFENQVDGYMTVGKSIYYDYTTTVKDTAPVVNEVILNDTAKKYFTCEVSDVKTTDEYAAKRVKVTAVASMSMEDTHNMEINGTWPQIRVNISFGEHDRVWTYGLPLTTASNVTAPLGLSMSIDKTSASVGDDVNVAAQVSVSNGFGGTMTDDYADVVWYVNGTKAEFKDGVYTVKSAIGEEIATAEQVEDYYGVLTAIKFNAKKAGSYTIKVETADKSYSASKPVTVTSDVTLGDGSPWIYTKDGDLTAKEGEKGNFAVQAGSTVDLSGLKFAMWDSNKNANPISAFDGTATWSVKSITINGTPITLTDAVKAAVAVKDNTVTIADATNAAMAEMLALADGEPISVSMTAKIKFGSAEPVEMWEKQTVTITVTTPSDKVDNIEYYAGDKKIGEMADKDLNMPVLTVGTPVTVSVKAMDENKFTDGISQAAIYAITNTNPNDTTVYATVDQTTGVVTPLVPCTGAAKLTIVPVANTAAAKTVNLYIVADPTATVEPTATPEPSVEPTAEPTVEPTAEPTAAPVVRTGVVVNVSSNLNIREAATTSSTVVTKVKNGTNLIILGEEGNFYKVQLADGKIGYASKDYVRETTDTPVQPTGDYAIVTTSGGRLNMRQTAGGAVITSIANGTRVDVISEGSEWTLIEYNGRQGYVSTAYLTIYHGAVG